MPGMPSETRDDLHGRLEAARAGDAGALDQLLRAYGPVTIRIVELRLGRRIRDAGALEEIVQECLVEVFRGLDHFAMHSEGDFRNWLARLVEGRVRERLQRRQGPTRRTPRIGVPVPSLLAWIQAGDPLSTSSALDERLERVLMYMLEEPHREVLILRKLCGMSDEETARHLDFGCTEAARALYAEALEQLHERLQS